MTEPILDVSSWVPAGEEQRGDKPKQWLREPSRASGAGRLWLWKESTWNTVPSGRYRKGDDWAEVLARRIGGSLGIPVAIVQLATRGSVPGVVSPSVLSDDESLILGDVVLADAGIDVHEHGRRSGYTLDAVEASLRAVAPTPPTSAPSGFAQFVSYLVLDALIGNTDRHEENWGVIQDPGGQRRLAPSFDHASAFGFQLADHQRKDYLEGRPVDVARWAARARTKFVGAPHPCELAVQGLGRTDPGFVQQVRDQIESLDVRAESDEIPSSRWSPVSRAFAIDVAEANRDRLLSHLIRTLAT